MTSVNHNLLIHPHSRLQQQYLQTRLITNMADTSEKRTSSEKIAYETQQEPVFRDASLKAGSISDEDQEVFKKTGDVDYRSVTWQRAIIIFIKTQIATGVLGIPSSLYTLGAVGGGLCIVGFQALNCYTTVIAGNFRNRHPECHSMSSPMLTTRKILTPLKQSWTWLASSGVPLAVNLSGSCS